MEAIFSPILKLSRKYPKLLGGVTEFCGLFIINPILA